MITYYTFEINYEFEIVNIKNIKMYLFINSNS